MHMRYEKPRPGRYVVDRSDGTERILILPPRPWKVLLMVTMILAIWAVGFIQLLHDPQADEHFPLVMRILCGVILAYTVGLVAWMFFGVEELRAFGGDLHIGYRLFFLSRRRMYRGSEIRGLSGHESLLLRAAHRNTAFPLIRRNRFGGVTFTYGGRTVYAAPTLSAMQGAVVVKRLAARLPGGATAR